MIFTISALEGTGVGGFFPPAFQADGTKSIHAPLALIIWDLQ